MTRKIGAAFIVWICLIWVLDPRPAQAQLVLGQYEDEAPFRTWNSFAPAQALAIGRGGTCFALASDSSSSLSNPALLLLLPKWTATINGSVYHASFFKYSLVNTGVLGSDGNLSQSLYALDFSGVSLHLGKWAFALSLGIHELYNRPTALAEYSPKGGAVLYSLSLIQQGILRNLNLSAARNLNDWLSAGLGINYSFGDLTKDMNERWTQVGTSITDTKTRDLKELYLNGGLLAKLGARIRLAAVFRTPSRRQSRNRSLLEYAAPAGNTDIRIETSSEDRVKQPFILGLGASYEFRSDLKAALDLSYYNWSRYSIDYFGETLGRDFRNILKIGAGVELRSSFRILGQAIGLPARLGFIVDPQPMKNPRSSYASLTFGSGIIWKSLQLDFGALLGREWGSGNNLAARKLSASLTIKL